MFLYLRNQRKSATLSNDRLLFIAAGLQSASYGQTVSKVRSRGVQQNLVSGSYLPLYFLLNSPYFHLQGSFWIQNSAHCYRPKTRSLYCMINYTRSFSGIADPVTKSIGKKRCGNDSVECDHEDVERIYRLVYKTYPCDVKMELILDLCQIHLTHELVWTVLERFKLAWRPAFRFFRWVDKKPDMVHNSRTCNKMMLILGRARQTETMLLILDKMSGKSLLTMDSFVICIRCFADAKEPNKAFSVLHLMEKHKFKVDTEMFNCLFHALGGAKLGYESLRFLENLKNQFSPNLKTYTILLDGWFKLGNLKESERTWNEMISNGFTPHSFAYNVLLLGLLRNGKRSDAFKVFREMKSQGVVPSVHSYTILLQYHCQNAFMRNAMDLMDDMVDSGCKPDLYVYNYLMMGFFKIKKLDMVYRIMNDMIEQGIQPDIRTYNAMIKMMMWRKMPEDTVKIYKKMLDGNIRPNADTFCMMMKAYLAAKDCEMVFRIWEEMKINGVCPDEHTYTVLIVGLIRQGKPLDACIYLQELLEKGMRPHFNYTRVRAEFSKAGKSDLWEHVVQKMELKLGVSLPRDYEESKVFAQS